jgi:endonuclease YncB( thermonuclease family)
MPGGAGCLTARGLRNVVICAAPSVTVILTRFLSVDWVWRAATTAWGATCGARRRAPSLGSLSAVVVLLAGVAKVARLAAWLVAIRLALVPFTYGLDWALARLRVPRRRAWAPVEWLHALALDVAFPSRSLRRACWAVALALGLRLKFPARARAPAWGGGGRFHAVVERCHDGDTCRVTLPGLPDVFGSRIGVRIRGIDAAEMCGAQCPLERCLALDARDYLAALVVGRNTTLDACARDKYFRLLCDLSVDGEDVGGRLLRGGYAVRYGGSGAKHSWCGAASTGAPGERARRCEAELGIQ